MTTSTRLKSSELPLVETTGSLYPGSRDLKAERQAWTKRLLLLSGVCSVVLLLIGILALWGADAVVVLNHMSDWWSSSPAPSVASKAASVVTMSSAESPPVGLTSGCGRAFEPAVALLATNLLGSLVVKALAVGALIFGAAAAVAKADVRPAFTGASLGLSLLFMPSLLSGLAGC